MKKQTEQYKSAKDLKISTISIKQLFGKEFLSNLKKQLNSKVKGPRNITNNHESVITNNNHYEKEIQHLYTIVEEIKRQNEHLRSTIHQITTSISDLQNKDQRIQSLKLIVERSTTIMQKNKQSQSQKELLSIGQFQQLRKRVRNFQAENAMKEERIKELLKKQVMNGETINLLKYKNDQLEQQLQKLKNLAGSQTEDDEKVVKTHKMNNPNESHTSLMNSSVITISSNQPKNSSTLPVINQSINMMASTTQMMEMTPNNNHISAKIQKVQSEEQNQIDNMLAEHLPQIKEEPSIEGKDILNMNQQEQKIINVHKPILQSKVNINISRFIGEEQDNLIQKKQQNNLPSGAMAKKINSVSKNAKQQINLFASYTVNIDFPDQFNINNVQKETPHTPKAEVNYIDDIISNQLRFVKDSVKHNEQQTTIRSNIQQSSVIINL